MTLHFSLAREDTNWYSEGRLMTERLLHWLKRLDSFLSQYMLTFPCFHPPSPFTQRHD
jgi:hypothetical protein